MKFFQKIKLQKRINFLEYLTRNALLTFLFLFSFSLIFGVALYLKYYIFIKQKPIEITERPSGLKTKIYSELLNILEERKKQFKEAESQQYSNPFLQNF